MSTEETLSSTIINWAATRTDESVINPTHGYYPFSIIAEAFAKGVEHGEKNFKEKVRGQFFSNATLVVKAIDDLQTALIKLNFQPIKLFVNISFESSKVLLTFEEETYLTDDFIDNAYSLSSEIKTKYFDQGLVLDLGFLIDKNININTIKSDGFEISFDLISRNPVY